MKPKNEKITVKRLKKILENVPPETEITFDSANARKIPLIFNQSEINENDRLTIELRENNSDRTPLDLSHEAITAWHFLNHLSDYGDHHEIIFSSRQDAVCLKDINMDNAMSIQLEPMGKYRWRNRR